MLPLAPPPGRYGKLRRKLHSCEEYETFQVDDSYVHRNRNLSPSGKRAERKTCFDKANIEVPQGQAAVLYIAKQPGPIASCAFMWKVPALEASRNQSKELAAVARCQETLKARRSRKEVSEIQEKCSSLVKMKPAIAKGIMREMGVFVPAGSRGGAALSERVLEHLNLSGSHAAL